MRKQAGVTAKSIDDLVDILNKAKVSNAKKLVDKAMFDDNGTGSFFLDMLNLKNNNSLHKINKAYSKMQRGLADMDMKSGYKAHKYLTNKKSRLSKSIGNSFISSHEFPIESIKGSPDKFIKVNSAKITQPITNTKNVVVPLAGTVALANAIHSPVKDGENLE